MILKKFKILVYNHYQMILNKIKHFFELGLLELYMGQSIQGGLSKFCGKQSLKICLSRPYPFKILKGCLPQNLLSPLLNNFSNMSYIKCVLLHMTEILFRNQSTLNNSSQQFSAIF